MNKTLSNHIRHKIIGSMYHMQRIGEFEGTEEESMEFERCSDKELIEYRDGYLVHLNELVHGTGKELKEYLGYLKRNFFEEGENILNYYEIKKTNVFDSRTLALNTGTVMYTYGILYGGRLLQDDIFDNYEEVYIACESVAKDWLNEIDIRDENEREFIDDYARRVLINKYGDYYGLQRAGYYNQCDIT